MADEIEPLEALHILLSTVLPSDVVGRIHWPEWFRFPDDETTSEQHETARRVLHSLHDGVKCEAIAATAVFNGEGQRVVIHPADFRYGAFDIAKRTLNCSIHGAGKRVYCQVLLKREDVEALARTLSGRGKVECSAAAYSKHWDEVARTIKVWPSDPEDEDWAKANGYSVDSVRLRRKEFIEALPAYKREHIQKGGRRTPFPEPGGNI